MKTRTGDCKSRFKNTRTYTKDDNFKESRLSDTGVAGQ